MLHRTLGETWGDVDKTSAAERHIFRRAASWSLVGALERRFAQPARARRPPRRHRGWTLWQLRQQLCGIGAAWVFTNSGGVWTQQGSKLVGTGAVGGAFQGWSVALSGDGNTAVVGGYFDNNATGAAWVYTRSNGIWTQQGSKLVANDSVGPAFQGTSVALSADGNTVIVGGLFDNFDSNCACGIGAAWVFTNSGGVWTQQGSKLVGTGAVGGAFQGRSVALSGDGALIARCRTASGFVPSAAAAAARTASL
jgi:hypothetical protein